MTFRWPTKEAFVLRTDAAFAPPGIANLCWCRNVGSRASKRCAGAAFRARDVCIPFFGFRQPTKEAFVLRTDAAFLWLQGYQTCGGAGMLAPGLANAVLAQHFVLEVFADLS